MKKLPKCDFCNKPIDITDCVFVHSVRWINGHRYEHAIQTCNNCYDTYTPYNDKEVKS